MHYIPQGGHTGSEVSSKIITTERLDARPNRIESYMAYTLTFSEGPSVPAFLLAAVDAAPALSTFSGPQMTHQLNLTQCS